MSVLCTSAFGEAPEPVTRILTVGSMARCEGSYNSQMIPRAWGRDAERKQPGLTQPARLALDLSSKSPWKTKALGCLSWVGGWCIRGVGGGGWNLGNEQTGTLSISPSIPGRMGYSKNRTRVQLSGGVGEMSPGATILPAGLRLALEGTVDGVHQEAEQATI